MALPRQVTLSFEYDGTARKTTATSANTYLGDEIRKSATALTYTDIASGESDRISVTMQDISSAWIGERKPERGATLGAAVFLTNWKGTGVTSLIYGNFTLDDITFSGRPLTCVLDGVSVPISEDFKSLQKTKTWEKTTIKDIAAEIAAAAEVVLVYDAGTVQIDEIEQNRETDSSFLYSLCEKYGLAMKVYALQIVIFDITAYEEKDAVATLNETDMLSWSYNSTVEGTYTGVTFSYTNPDIKDTLSVTVGEEGRMYSVNSQASSKYDAELQATAKVNEANRNIETMNVSIPANLGIVASQCVNIAGLGRISGKYYVDKAVHSVGSGYKMQLTLHKVQDAVKTDKTAASGGESYTVVSGDTLWGISKKYYGTGTKYNLIYEANAELIESTAKSHGKTDSDNGHWIWPGEILTIPTEE